MNNYCIVLSRKRLSAFYPNKCGNQLSFRKRDRITFDSFEDAEGYINYIQKLSNKATGPLALQLRVINDY